MEALHGYFREDEGFCRQLLLRPVSCNPTTWYWVQRDLCHYHHHSPPLTRKKNGVHIQRLTRVGSLGGPALLGLGFGRVREAGEARLLEGVSIGKCIHHSSTHCVASLLFPLRCALPPKFDALLCYTQNPWTIRS